MKAALVLLSSSDIQNFTRRIAVELNTRKGLPFYAATLPAHVSLKQPFVFEDFERLDAYCDRLAARTTPFEIHLDRFYLFEGVGHGVLVLEVVETARLRELHTLLNLELASIFQDTRAAYDGADYRFHLTIEIAREARSLEILREYFERLAVKTIDLRFTARELGVFFYPDMGFAPGSFIVYRVIPLASTC